MENDFGNLEIKTQPMALSRLPYMVTHIKRGLVDAAEGANKTEPAPTSFSRRIHMSSPEKFSLKPYHRFLDLFGSTEVKSRGEHINVSLNVQDKQGNSHNLTQLYNNKQTSPWTKLLGYTVSRICANDYSLFDGHHSAAERFDEQGKNGVCGELNTPSSMDDVIKINGKTEQTGRIEFRYPDSSHNSFLGMLAVGTAVFAAVDSAQIIYGEQGFPKGGKINVAPVREYLVDHYALQTSIALDTELSLKRFKDRSNVIDVLHTIVDEQITDEQENQRYHADVERLKAAVIARSEQLMQRDEGISK